MKHIRTQSVLDPLIVPNVPANYCSGGLQVSAVYDVEPSGTESPRQAPLIAHFVHVFGSTDRSHQRIPFKYHLSGGHSHSLAALVFLPI
jgi:hypothetical protein